LKKTFTIFLRALFLSVLFFGGNSYAQNGPVKLIFAERVSDYKGQVNTTKAIGNVQFEHNSTKLFCDSAIFLQTPNLIYAYGNVQINQGDTVNLFCDSLLYNGKTNISKLWGHVRFRDQEYKLVTDSLEYNGNLSKGYYQNGAVITSINQDLKLTSVKGYYFSSSKIFFFKDSVHVEHPDYELFSDTLEFRTLASSAHFHGPTRVLMDSMELHCNKGIYYTDKQFMRLWEGATMFEKTRTFYADSLIFDQLKDEGEGFCGVRMYDSTEKVLFLSDYLKKTAGNTEIMLRDNAHVIQFGNSDTLFLSADTIYHKQDTLTDFSQSIAINFVEIISSGMFVACDSAYFSEQDSILKLHKNPVMWNNLTQISGDSILALYYDNEFQQLDIFENSFIASQQDTLHYDQMKGELMTAYLDSSEIKRIQITTNAETMYYLSETKKDSAGVEVKTIQGMNKIDCNYIVIHFAKTDSTESEISTISFNEQPTGVYTPIDDVTERELFLKGFLWQIGRKPKPILLE
jgi:lipopolysaccharide export system protein LptA